MSLVLVLFEFRFRREGTFTIWARDALAGGRLEFIHLIVGDTLVDVRLPQKLSKSVASRALSAVLLPVAV